MKQKKHFVILTLVALSVFAMAQVFAADPPPGTVIEGDWNMLDNGSKSVINPASHTMSGNVTSNGADTSILLRVTNPKPGTDPVEYTVVETLLTGTPEQPDSAAVEVEPGGKAELIDVEDTPDANGDWVPETGTPQQFEGATGSYKVTVQP